MLESFDKDRASIFAYCCGAATHFNPKLPYRPFNTGILFAMEEIKPYDPEHEEAFHVDTSAGRLWFAGVTSNQVKSNPDVKEYTFSGDYMGYGRRDMFNKGEGVFPPDTIKHGQFHAMVTNKTFQQFLDHKGVCLWVDIVSDKNACALGKTFYGLLNKYPEFKKEFDKSIIYKSAPYYNMRYHSSVPVLQLIVTDRGN